MGCRADIKPVLCRAAGVHQIFFLIYFFLHVSVGPALLGAVDGQKGPQTEREWSPALHWRLGTKGLPSSQSPCILPQPFNSYSSCCRLLSPIHSFSPPFQLYRPLSDPDSAVSFPFIVKTWANFVLTRHNHNWLLVLGGTFRLLRKWGKQIVSTPFEKDQ